MGRGCFEEGEAAVAAEGDEVELACLLSSFEAYGHGLDLAGVRENGSSSARMPTHVVIGPRHEWGTRCDWD